MRKSTLILTRQTLARLKPHDQIYWFGGIHENLGVYVAANGTATWKVRLNIVQPGGVKRKIGSLGPVEQHSIEDAVALKKAADVAARDGVDLTDRKTQREQEQPPTLSFLLDLYIASAELRAATVTRYQKAKVHIDVHLGSILVRDLNKADILRLQDALRATKNTFNKCRDLISAAYNYFGDRGTKHAGKVLVPEDHNPARRVHRWTDKEMNRRKSDPYTAAEAQALLAAAEPFLNPEKRSQMSNQAQLPRQSTIACILAMIYSGCRKTEIMGLSKHLPPSAEPEGWTGWVDMQAGIIRLVHTKTGPREVPIVDQLGALLAFMWDCDPFWMFPGRAGGRIGKIEKTWNTLHRRAGVRRRNPHQTRHTMVHHMVDQGEGLVAAGKAVGHTSVWTTQFYVGMGATSERRALEKGANAIGPLDWEFLRQKTAPGTPPGGLKTTT